MLISELVKQLQDELVLHGDVPVVVTMPYKVGLIHESLKFCVYHPFNDSVEICPAVAD